MAGKPLNLQDLFLNSLRRAKTPVTIFLVKGVKLQGIVTWFDNFSLLLRRDGTSQLVYKHAISTIMPAQLVDIELPPLPPPGGEGRRLPLQDVFLTAAARQHEPVTMFLVNGVMLQGAVAAFDQFSLLLVRMGQAQLVYKHAISTVQPAHPLALAEEQGLTEEDED
jgi:host factor-I protein